MDGVRRKATKAITVREDGGFPEPDLQLMGDRVFPVGTTATFDHSGSISATGAILKFTYNFGRGGLFESYFLEETVSHTFTEKGVTSVELYVEEEGRTRVLNFPVYPTAGQGPTVSYSLSSRIGVAPLTVNFDGSFSFDDGTIDSYHWGLDDDSSSVIGQYANGVTVSHTYNQPGINYPCLTVVDNSGNVNMFCQKVIVLESANANNLNPTASFTFSINGLRVTFDASSSTDSDGTIKFYEWNFGDGKINSREEDTYEEHTFDEGGMHEVILKVTDNEGGTHSVTNTIVIPTDS